MEFINVKLSDIGEIVGGSTPSTKNLANYDGNIAWITPKDLAGYSKVYISRGERNISENGFKSCSTKMLPKNSVLFSSRAPIGYVAISENDLCTNQGFKSIIPNSKVDYKFLYYLLKHKKDYIASKGSGSTFKEVSGSVMKGIELSIPKDINIQKKVSKVLFDIDQKIELNNKINNNLHQYCIDFFERLFNDFESEDTLENLCYEITRGYTKNYVERSKIINLNQKVNKGELLEKNYYKFLDENQTIPNNKFAKKNDILLNSLGQGTLGRIHLFGEEVNNVVVDQHITVLRTGNRINPYYLYYLLITPEYKNKIESSVTGTTGMLMINISNVRNLRVPIPTREKLDIFEQVVCPIREKITYNNLENEKLSDLRDALLPKLMNGEIDLENIEI